MGVEYIPIFFEPPIETHCPVCGGKVRKVIESRRKSTSDCQNEFWAHEGDVLIKFKNPIGAWQNSAEYIASNG